MNYLGPYLLGPNDTPENGIYIGDARELVKAIPDESVDLIFTDPPYAPEFVPLFGWLAEVASRVLKPGCLCLTLSGAAYLDEIIPLMSMHLQYHWLGGMPHSMGRVAKFHPRQMMDACKPMLWFAKGKAIKHPYVFDYFWSRPSGNKWHKWEQPAPWFAYYIGKLAEVDSIVLDPLTGGGTVPAVCSTFGQKYVGFEIDPDTAKMARERVRNTQPPLFVPEPEQQEMAL